MSDNTFKWWRSGDLDGFFGLFVDNFVQLLLIVALCSGLCGMSGKHAYLLYQEILPAVIVPVRADNTGAWIL